MANTSRYLLLGGVVMMMAQMMLMAERKEFSEYQCIVDRQMFGQPPPGFDPTKPPSEVSSRDERAKEQELSKEQEQLKSSIRFSMINQTPSGEVKVGFSDNSDPKNPKSYYLKVGESCNGWTVKEADALKEEMTVVKGEVEVTLNLGGDSASNAGATKSTRASGGGSGLDRMGRPARGLGSLSLRRQQREKEREASEAAARAEREEAARQREEEKAQRDKEREEQRAQMMQIQEELRKAREQREKEEAKKKEKDDDKGDDDGGDE